MLKNVSPLYYWLVLYRRRWSILAILAVSVISAILLSNFYPAIYEAQSVFFIPVNDTNREATFFDQTGRSSIKQNAFLPADKDAALKPYIGYLKSREIAVAVQKEFPHKQLTNYIRNDIDFEVTEEGMLRMYSRDRNASLAAAISASYLKHLDDMMMGLSQDSLKANIASLERSLGDLRTQMAENNRKVAQYMQKHKMVSSGEEERAMTTQKQALLAALDQNQSETEQNAAQLKAQTEELRKEDTLLSNQNFDFDDPEIIALKGELNQLGSDIAAQGVRVGEKNVSLESLRAKYGATEQRLNEALKRLVSNQIKPKNSMYEDIRSKIVNLLVSQAGLEAQRQGQLKALEAVSARMAEYAEESPEFDSLQKQGDAVRARYEGIISSMNETRLQMARQIRFVNIVDPPVPPATPSFPLLPINIIVAVLVGLAAGILYAFFVDYVTAVDRLSVPTMIRAMLSNPKADA